jgi:hypothetical protein
MFPGIQALFDQLASAIGVEALPANQDGGVQLSVGDNSTVVLFGEDEATLLVVSPVASLPKDINYGTVLWLLRRNFHDSPIAPFRVACDTVGGIVVWGRIPVDGMTGERLATLLDAIATEADLIREEVGVDEPPGTDARDTGPPDTGATVG